MKTLNWFRILLMHYKNLKEALEEMLRIEARLPPILSNRERQRTYELKLRMVEHDIQRTKKRIEDFAH